MNIFKTIQRSLFILLSVLIVTSSVMAQAPTLSKAEVQQQLDNMNNVFQSVKIKQTQDSLCIQEYTKCMDFYCKSAKADRCICSANLEDILPLRDALLSKKDKIEELVNVKIDALLTERGGATLADSDDPFAGLDDDDSLDSLFDDDESLETALAVEMADELYMKAARKCKSIARSCASDKEKNIILNYQQKISRSCDAYITHMQDKKEEMDKIYSDANRLYAELQNLEGERRPDFNVCLIKIKNCMRSQCGAGYNECYTCDNPRNEKQCEKQIIARFQLADRACAMIEDECGMETYDEALDLFNDEIVAGISQKIKKLRTGELMAAETVAEDLEKDLRNCVMEVCGLQMQNCPTEYDIENAMDDTCAYIYENKEFEDDFILNQARQRILIKTRNIR